MQTLNDGTEVTSRSYDYLLDWNDWNEKKFIQENFNKQKLRDLDKSEYQTLFNIATSQEFPIAPNQPTIVMLGGNIAKAKDYLDLVEKVKDMNLVSPWEQGDFYRNEIEHLTLKMETPIDPFIQSKSRRSIGIAAHPFHGLTISEMPLLETPPKVTLKELFYEEKLSYCFDKPKRRARGEKNKEFKQTIRNLTNKRK